MGSAPACLFESFSELFWPAFSCSDSVVDRRVVAMLSWDIESFRLEKPFKIIRSMVGVIISPSLIRNPCHYVLIDLITDQASLKTYPVE